MPRPVSQTSRTRWRAAPARADEHAARRRVLDRVGDQVLQQAAHETPVGADRERGWHEGERQALAAGDGLELALKLAEQLVDAEARPLRLHGARVEARDVEDGGEDFLDGVERGVDVLGERRIARVAVPLHERGRVEARGIERLQDVVRGGGEEARLGDVRLVGFRLRASERLVEARQLLGSLAHALFQRLVRAPARLLRENGVGDVRVGGDVAAVGQEVRADLDDLAGRIEL